MDISHYNTLLRVYLDNGTDFSPDTILTELATKELIPNRVTYQHLITKFCLVSTVFTITSFKLKFQDYLLAVEKSMTVPVSIDGALDQWLHPFKKSYSITFNLIPGWKYYWSHCNFGTYERNGDAC